MTQIPPRTADWWASTGALLSVLLVLTVHGVVAAVWVWPWAAAQGVIAAGCGAMLGAGLAYGLARRHLRSTWWVFAAAGLGLGLVLLHHHVWLHTQALAAYLEPAQVLVWGDVLLFGLGCMLASALLRLLSLRRRVWVVLELSAVALAFANLVSSHRHGAIHRPFEIADPLIAQGHDPTVALLIVGALASALVVVLLIREYSLLRMVLNLAVLFALVMIVVLGRWWLGLPSVPASDDALGLRGKAKQAQPKDGKKSSGRYEQDEMEFKDNYDSKQKQNPAPGLRIQPRASHR